MARADELVFVRATEKDVDRVVSVLDEAAQWHVDHGIEQWTPGGFRWDWIGPPIKRGWTYLVQRGGKVVGTVSLEEHDRWLWGRDRHDAMYVHRFAVVGSERGHGLGRAILDWCAERTVESGRRFLRLDCPRDNPKLRAYYEGLGFVHRGNKTMSGDWGTYHSAKYEKALA